MNIRLKKNKLNIIDKLPAPFITEKTFLKNDDRHLTGEDVKIGIIGTGGVDHKDIKNIEDFESFSDNGINKEDSFGLSTICSGIIGANNSRDGLVGLAPNSKIYLTKTFNNRGEADLNSIIASVIWLTIKEVDIILIPFDIEAINYGLENSFKKAFDNNILIINNYYKINNDNSPLIEELLTVSKDKKEEKNNIHLDERKIMSCFLENKYVDLTNKFAYTSFVAGASALLIDKYKKSNKKWTHRNIIVDLKSYLGGKK